MLNQSQLPALKTFIEADQALAAFVAAGQMQSVADALNQEATPAFVVWRTSVSQDEIMSNGFDWVRVDNLSVGKARMWGWMFMSGGQINPSKANVRAGIDEVWKGTAADLAVRAAVYTHCKRNATIVEKLYATGAGDTENPALLAFEGEVTWQDVVNAMEVA